MNEAREQLFKLEAADLYKDMITSDTTEGVVEIIPESLGVPMDRFRVHFERKRNSNFVRMVSGHRELQEFFAA